MRRRFVLLVIGALVATLLGAAPTARREPKPEAGPTVYVGELTHRAAQAAVRSGSGP